VTRTDDDGAFWAQHGPLGLANYRRQLGRSEQLGDPVPAGEKLRVILLQSGATGRNDNRALGDAAASSMTITCSYRSDNAANDARPLQVRGLVQWGTDGHQASAYFDWLNGTTLHIASSFVRVIAEVVDNLTAAEVTPTHSAEAICTVGAFLGYFASSQLSPTLTEQVRLEEDGTEIVEIPQFARELTVYGPQVDNAQWLLGPTLGLAFGAVDPAGLASSQRYVRPGPATHVALQADLPGVRTLVWGLAL